MKTYRIAVLPGDGIGPEVISEGLKVLKQVAARDGSLEFQFTSYPWGCRYYAQHGEMMPEDGLDTLKSYDAIYLGAVGDPGVPDHISLGGLLLKIRQGFDEYVNYRPVVLLPGAPCPLKGMTRDRIQMTFIRENSEGEYSGTGCWLYRGKPNEVVIQNSVFSRSGTERIIRYAYRLAQRERKTLTSVSKGNALNYSMVFWDQIFREVGREFPDVVTHSYLVDAASMMMVLHPERFQIVVTSNLFGDILTDLGAAISGGMGLAAGANLNPERVFPSMFESIHGSAPDIAGKGIANPMASVWAAGQMLDFLGLPQWGARILRAIESVLSSGDILTPDLGGHASTSEVGSAIADRI